MARRMAREPKNASEASVARTLAAETLEIAEAEQALAKAPARTTKISNVLALLRRAEGATLAELIDATGWQPHTTRAALTGLKKKGYAIEKSKREDVICYSVMDAS